MSLTLWRGDQLLGDLYPQAPDRNAAPQRDDKPPSMSAFLIPATNATPVGIWQIHWLFPEFSTVHQQAVEPDIVAERHQQRVTRPANAKSVDLQPMAPEEIRGVPRELQLTVRDERGTRYLPSMIRVQESRFEAAHLPGVLQQIPPEALTNGSVWSVLISFSSHADAPVV